MKRQQNETLNGVQRFHGIGAQHISFLVKQIK